MEGWLDPLACKALGETWQSEDATGGYQEVDNQYMRPTQPQMTMVEPKLV